MANESPWAIIGAFTEELAALNKVREAQGQTPFVARVFVRSMFSIFDGYAFYLKRQALAGAPRAGVSFSPSELERLTEQRKVMRGGREIVVPRIIPSGENLLFACKKFAQVYGAEPPLANDALPPQFTVAAEVRNRITHPKETADFNVSPSEARAIGELVEWFQTLMTWVKDQEHRLIESVRDEVRRSFDEARAQLERRRTKE